MTLSVDDMLCTFLQGECARFGVRALPKRKMIAKLEEIYDYTHPLVGTGMPLLVITIS